MTSSEIPKWRGCPTRYAAGIFGDKWTLLIIRDLMFKGRRYYGDFLDAGEGISTNILADRLVKLERNKIINRQVDLIKKSKVVYTLTDKGLALMPTMLAMMQWSEHYDADTEVAPEFASALRENRDRLQQDLWESVRRKDRSLLQ